ncbi:MAG: hypothetical protein CL946_01405 [Ectothiorhodospiraceae bacterium]|nr:hypothetical protein [Ectothiorhodospiraceae bacterium]
MTLVRWNPVKEMVNLQNEINRMFHDTTPAKEEEYRSATWSPLADVVEDGDTYTIHMDMPGLEKKDIEMNFLENTLAVTGERTAPEREGVTSHRVERIYGKFFRKFRFPHPVDSNKIEAKFNDGVLTITVPKAEEAKPRQIEIR